MPKTLHINAASHLLLSCVNMFLYCGSLVYNYVHFLRINRASFTHYTQALYFNYDTKKICTFFYSRFTHSLHTLIMQFSSVIMQFYTLYTGPTITTTYNIFKKG